MMFSVKRYSWHYLSVVCRYVIAFGILVGTLFCWWITRRGGDWPLRIFSAVFSIFAIGMLTEQVTYVDHERQQISRKGLLFGYIRLWQSTWPLNEFRAIALRRYVDSDNQITFFVELIRLSGRRLGVRCFFGSAYTEALDAARNLARVTGLQIEEEG